MSNFNCTLSIIVPNYNYAHYLDERLQSIINQTFQDFELILLDDASTDNSAEVLNKYKTHPKVSQIIINEKNSGSPFKQWMKGISLAKGKWIWIAEADDSAELNFLETCMQHVNEENLSFVYTGTKCMNDKSEYIEGDFNLWNGREKDGYATFSGEDFASHNLYWRNTVINASAAIFPKEKALHLQHEDFLKMKNCGDWLFWFRMALQGNVTEIYQNLNIYRFHQSQTKKGMESGLIWEESFSVSLYMEAYFPNFSNYKKKLHHASIYRIVRKMKNHTIKKKLKDLYKQSFNSNPTLDYYFLKFNLHLSFIPWVITEDKDRLRKK